MKKKWLLLLCMAGMLSGILALSYDDYTLRQKIQYLEERIESVDPDEELRQKWMEQMEAETERNQAVEIIQKSSVSFLTDLFSAPSSQNYGQVPAVQGYLTDKGIQSLLTHMDPEHFDQITEEDLQEIRNENVSGEENRSSIRILESRAFVQLSDGGNRAESLVLAECNYDEDSRFPTCTILMEMEFYKESEWKIDAVSEFKQV